MAKKRERTTFDEYYRTIFPQRWERLKEALMEESPSTAFAEAPLLKPYYLDEASVLAARALDLQPDDSVLDMCAAPGGKALVLASRLGTEGKLTVNEKSRERRARLIRVLKEHLPEELFARISVSGYDASRWCLHEQDAFDRILLDVPCSSERHLLHSPAHLAMWSPARTRHLSVQAYAILSSAFRTVKPGGEILYSTCALSPLENDEVIRKLLKKQKDAVNILPSGGDGIGEETEFGRIILPDESGGRGPMFWCRIRRAQ